MAFRIKPIGSLVLYLAGVLLSWLCSTLSILEAVQDLFELPSLRLG
jgi:hypothetical protein